MVDPGLLFGGQPLPLPFIPLPLPFPFLRLPFPFLLLPSPCLPPSLPPNPARESGERCKLPQWSSGQSPGRKCILKYILRHRNVSGGNNFAPFCTNKMSIKTEKCTYLTLILRNCYSSEDVQHQALKTRFLFIVKPFIYCMAPIFWAAASARLIFELASREHEMLSGH